MKAALFRRPGGPEVIEYTDAPDPVPGHGQVLVRVKACGVNHLDHWLRQGLPAYRLQFPHIAGSDVAGVIERVGPGVTACLPGARVVLAPGFGCRQCAACQAGWDNHCLTYGIRGAAIPGGYAELVVADARDVLPLPASVSFETAAAFPLVFLTAWHMLVTRAGLKAGETVLVHAAGSGVGHAAISIAQHLKATVYTTVGSQEKVAKAQALGVAAVINYQTEDMEARIKELTQQRGVHVVFEHIGPATFEKSLRVLAKGGRLVTCGATSGPSVPLDLRYVYSRQLSIFGSMMGRRPELEELSPLVFSGRLQPIIDAVLPLRCARQAHERLLQRNIFGKLVLAP